MTQKKAERRMRGGGATASGHNETTASGHPLQGEVQLWLAGDDCEEVELSRVPHTLQNTVFHSVEEWSELAEPLKEALEEDSLPCGGSGCMTCACMCLAYSTLCLLPWPCWCISKNNQEQSFIQGVNKVLKEWNSKQDQWVASLQDVSELWEPAYIAFSKAVAVPESVEGKEQRE